MSPEADQQLTSYIRDFLTYLRFQTRIFTLKFEFMKQRTTTISHRVKERFNP
jgi:hypothetical protein